MRGCDCVSHEASVFLFSPVQCQNRCAVPVVLVSPPFFSPSAGRKPLLPKVHNQTNQPASQQTNRPTNPPPANNQFLEAKLCE